MENDYYLTWDNYKTTLSSGFNSLLKDETLVDVTLAADGKYVKAHKTVLSICSPYFKELFQVNPCKHPIVILPNVNYNDLCNLLSFMYQGEVSINQEEITSFIKVAEMLKVKGLTNNNSSTSVQETANRIEDSYKDEMLIQPKEEPLDPLNDSASYASLGDNDIDLELSTKTEVNNDELLIESDEEFEESSTCPRVARKGRDIDLLPDKSKVRYIKEYISFKQFCERKNMDYKIDTEKAMLDYLKEKSEIMKSSSLWVKYAMVKATLKARDNIYEKFPKVVKYLKNKSIGYKSNPTPSFTREDINKFLKEAPDDSYLMMKLVLIIAISGCCGTQDLVKMSINDVEDKGSHLIVKLPPDGTKNQRTFIINSKSKNGLNLIDFYRRYIALRKPETEHKRLFVNYKEGQCTVQVVGKHSISAIPRIIARFLQKPQVDEYSGSSFRKTAGKLMNNSELIL